MLALFMHRGVILLSVCAAGSSSPAASLYALLPESLTHRDGALSVHGLRPFCSPAANFREFSSRHLGE